MLAGEMGCFKMEQNFTKPGCNYDCENPDDFDCNHRNITIHQDLPTLKRSINTGDICLCKGDYCNDEEFPRWANGVLIVGFIIVVYMIVWVILIKQGQRNRVRNNWGFIGAAPG